MIFKMRSPNILDPKAPQLELYLLVEGDANGIFFGVYNTVESAQKCAGGMGLLTLKQEEIAECEKERYSMLEDNTGKRKVVDKYA